MKSHMVALLAFSVCVTGFLVAEDYPPPYPRECAKKLFENDRVVAWEMTWKKNVEQPCHKHLYDMATVYFRYGGVDVTTPDGKVSHSRPFGVPRTCFQYRGLTHKEQWVGGPNDPE